MRKAFLLAILCPVLSLAQPTKNHEGHRPLTVGDTLPVGVLDPKLQTPNTKLLILDFWASWCTSCLRHFPRLDSVQQQYNGQVQVVLVNSRSTGDSPEKIRAVFEKRQTPGGRKYSFPLLNGDTVLSALFPHKLLPHTVWLDSGRRVVAITTPAELTAANIETFLQTGSLVLKQKADAIHFNRKKPLFFQGNGGSGEAIRFRSLLTPHISGLPTGSATDRDAAGCITRILFTNHSLLRLYQYAWQAFLPPAQVRLQVADPSRLTNTLNDPQWTYDHTWTYELMVPPSTDEEVRRRMRYDLESFFGYTARLLQEEDRLPVFIITEKGAPADAPLPARQPVQRKKKTGSKNKAQKQHKR